MATIKQCDRCGNKSPQPRHVLGYTLCYDCYRKIADNTYWYIVGRKDFAPVFYSSWNERGDDWVYKYDCSNCGHGVQRRTPYCPFCGAIMDKKKEG